MVNNISYISNHQQPQIIKHKKITTFEVGNPGLRLGNA
jgi:hypothetical protein